MSWIDSRGATLSELHKRGGLWVVEKLPDTGREKVECWTATAKPKEKVQGLVSQWAQSGRLGKLPRTMEMRMRYFEAAMRHQGELMLIVRDAHNLRGFTLDKMRLFVKRGRVIVLEGDVARISVATDDYPGFWQRASYVVHVTRLFE